MADDLFKIKHPKPLYNIGIFENNSEIVTFVEWPQIISDKITYLLLD